MARDRLLPPNLARVSGRGTPVRITLFTAVIVSLIAGVFPLADIAALANAGTLTAFIAVAVCMLVMRRREPNAPRTFRAPAGWLVGFVAIGGCLYLLYSLPQTTQIYFLVAHVIGLAIYLLYGSRRSEAGREAAA
jgi:basic amino acid/polyamine antiporter, APA family